MTEQAVGETDGNGGACPCGTGRTYDACCRRLHVGGVHAFTAEQLMRSRFSAFAVGDDAYLLRSWHASTRPKRLVLDQSIRWTRLEVVAATGGGPLDERGTVSFRAHYETVGSKARTGILRELSEFVREDGRWVYVGPRNV